MSPALLTLGLFLFGLFIGIGLTLWLRRPGTAVADMSTRNAPDALATEAERNDASLEGAGTPDATVTHPANAPDPAEASRATRP